MRASVLGLLGMLLAPLAWAQDYGGLGPADAGFAEVLPERTLRFPDDHAPHPAFRLEWWYLTANLEAADGTPMGLQWTLFRQAIAPDAPDDGWAAGQLWMGHAAVTTPDDHRATEVFARGGIGQAGVEMAPFEAFINDWSMRSTAPEGADPFSALSLSAQSDDFGYELLLEAQGPLVLQGTEGYSQKTESGAASHYYSQPFYTLSGTVRIDGQPRAVTGQAWLDREWSSEALQAGWDWFALHLPGGAKLMAYRVRTTDGLVFAPGTYIHPDGRAEPMPHGAFEISELARVTVAGREIPVEWRLALPQKGIDLAIAPVNAHSFMDLSFPYWEGPVTYSGSHEGVGYLEMTGY